MGYRSALAVGAGVTLDLDALLSQLREHEGVVLHAYEDHLGFLSIGIGRMIDRRRGGGISEIEARILLLNDVQKVLDGLDRVLPWWRGLDGVRQRVVADMAFNLGLSGFLRFRRTLAAIESGEWETAARQMGASLWARQVGRRARRLQAMMRTGEDVALSEVR